MDPKATGVPKADLGLMVPPVPPDLLAKLGRQVRLDPKATRAQPAPPAQLVKLAPQDIQA